MNISIIGVVGDSRFRSVRTPIDAIMFRKVTAGPGWMMIRYRGDPATVRAAVERQWKQITNEVPFNAKFGEDIIGEYFSALEARYGVTINRQALAKLAGGSEEQ
jgi:putative ABC transport system permease protein